MADKSGLMVRLTGEERSALERIAERWGVSLNEAVKRLIRVEDDITRRALPAAVISSPAPPVPTPARNAKKSDEVVCRIRGIHEYRGKGLR